MRVPPGPVQALFLRQHGVAARFQPVRLMSEKAVDGLMRRGSLVAVERGVYRASTTPVTPELVAMAALLRARPDAVLTGAFVLGLVDVDGFTVADPFAVLTRPGRSLTRVSFEHRPDVVHRRPPIHVGPLACVHPTVAVLDAIRQRPGDDRRFRVAVDVLRRRGQWIESRLSRELALRPADDPGARFVRDLLDSGALACETEPERLLGRCVLEVYPGAEPQVWITPRRRSDWYLRGPRLAIEFQGEVDHGHAAGRAEDARKAAEAEAVASGLSPSSRPTSSMAGRSSGGCRPSSSPGSSSSTAPAATSGSTMAAVGTDRSRPRDPADARVLWTGRPTGDGPRVGRVGRHG